MRTCILLSHVSGGEESLLQPNLWILIKMFINTSISYFSDPNLITTSTSESEKPSWRFTRSSGIKGFYRENMENLQKDNKRPMGHIAQTKPV